MINHNLNLMIPNRILQPVSELRGNPQPDLVESSEKETQFPVKQQSGVDSPQRQASVLKNSAVFLKSSVSPDKKIISTPLRAYDTISEFQQLQQLSDLIGIDVHV